MKVKFPASLRVIGRSFVDWWDGWMDMVLVTIVWFFAQITVVLGPPATFGFYYVVHNMQSGQATGVRGLIEGGRKYFGKAWLWGLANLAVVFITSFAVWFYNNVQAAWGFYAELIILIIAYLWVCSQFYGLAYFHELDEKNLYIAVKNGLLTTLAAPFFTLILIVLSVVVLALSFGFMLPLFLGLPGLIPTLGFRGVYDRLIAFGIRKPEKTPKEIEAEQSYRIILPEFDRSAQPDKSVGGSGSASSGDVAEGKGQVEQEK
jgi:hypothetical protein